MLKHECTISAHPLRRASGHMPLDAVSHVNILQFKSYITDFLVRAQKSDTRNLWNW